jgi:methionine synthase II (cobalamin-independent)
MDQSITAGISIEELVEILPGSVSYLSRKGIKCIACGEPIWGTLEEAAREKGFGEKEIAEFVRELNAMMRV